VFAQAQLANDVFQLSDGQWHWTTWLNAKGRVMAIFQLLRLDPQRLLLLSYDDNAEALAEQLRRFVFRRKVRISLEPVSLEAAFQTPTLATGSLFSYIKNGAIELDMGSSAQPRALHLIIGETTHAADEDKRFILAWQQADLLFGLPHLTPSQVQQWTVQQLGLERLAAYSVKKGCYPGQEIVARTHFLGKAAKRSVQLLKLNTSAPPGTPVTQQTQDIGTIVSSAGLLALAVLPRERATLALQVNGNAAQWIPFWEGLAR